MSTSFRDQLQSALGAAYTLERELGGGGMSHVYLAAESALDRRVVVKVLPPDTAGAISVERFKREIAVAARLQHAHIVPVLSAGEAGGLPYYTMPFVEGESLRARIARGGELPLRDAVRVLREVASALSFAHDHGIVHRDIKPDNVLIAGDSAMVTDFGVAKAVTASATDTSSGLTSLGVALGTPAYMAPEQATADPMVDHRADIYAFGCLAYELLSGQAPFAGRPSAAMLAAHVSESPEAIDRRRPSVPPALAALVMRCLEKRPADRPQKASEIVRALDDITTPSGGSAPTSLRMPATTATAPLPGSRRRLLAGGAVAAALVAVVAMVVMQGGGNRAESAPPASGTPASLAVLPLSTEGDTANEFFAQGMTEELTSALTKVSGLGVVSRTLTAATVRRNPDADVRAVGRQLNVAAVLEGSVRRAAGRLRINAQLTSVADGRILWSESYQGSGADVFQVQDSIARSIVSALQGTLGANTHSISVAGTRDPLAHERTLRARYYFTSRTKLDTAILLVRDALARDSTYAEAWSLLASIYAVLEDWTNAGDSATVRAQEYARKALALDSTLTDAYAALGNALVDAGRFDDAMQAYDKGISLNANHSQIHHWRGILLSALGRSSEALTDFRSAHALDPIAPNIHLWYASALTGAGDMDQALREFNAGMASAPQFFSVQANMAATLLAQGRTDIASAYADTAAEIIRTTATRAPVQMLSLGNIASVYAHVGRRADAERVLATIRATPLAVAGPYFELGQAAALDALGFPDSALTTLERARDLRATQFGIIELGAAWGMQNIRKHPRYLALARRKGLRN